MTIGAAILPNGLPNPAMPVPSEIEVVEGVNQASTYRLRYGFNIEEGDLPLLSESLLDPESVLSVVIPGDPLPKILVNGPVVSQSVTVTQGGDGSVVDVIGMDTTATMDRENKSAVHSNMNDTAIVSALLAQYALVPDVGITSVIHTDLTHSLVQRETDLRFVRRLARRNGFWFWLTDEAPGVTIGHFKPPPADAPPALDLRINVPDSNVDEVTINWNTERPVSSSLAQLDLKSLSDINGDSAQSTVSGLASNHLADLVSGTRQLHLAVPSDDSGDLITRGAAALMDHGWFVNARLTVRQTVLKDVVRAHSVVNLVGAGARHSGKYIVSRVAHTFNEEDHFMNVDLMRNSWN